MGLGGVEGISAAGCSSMVITTSSPIFRRYFGVGHVLLSLSASPKMLDIPQPIPEILAPTPKGIDDCLRGQGPGICSFVPDFEWGMG